MAAGSTGGSLGAAFDRRLQLRQQLFFLEPKNFSLADGWPAFCAGAFAREAANGAEVLFGGYRTSEGLVPV